MFLFLVIIPPQLTVVNNGYIHFLLILSKLRIIEKTPAFI